MSRHLEPHVRARAHSHIGRHHLAYGRLPVGHFHEGSFLIAPIFSLVFYAIVNQVSFFLHHFNLSHALVVYVDIELDPGVVFVVLVEKFPFQGIVRDEVLASFLALEVDTGHVGLILKVQRKDVDLNNIFVYLPEALDELVLKHLVRPGFVAFDKPAGK